MQVSWLLNGDGHLCLGRDDDVSRPSLEAAGLVHKNPHQVQSNKRPQLLRHLCMTNHWQGWKVLYHCNSPALFDQTLGSGALSDHATGFGAVKQAGQTQGSAEVLIKSAAAGGVKLTFKNCPLREVCIKSPSWCTAPACCTTALQLNSSKQNCSSIGCVRRQMACVGSACYHTTLTVVNDTVT